jgi:hypothetical protein
MTRSGGSRLKKIDEKDKTADENFGAENYFLFRKTIIECTLLFMDMIRTAY